MPVIVQIDLPLDVLGDYSMLVGLVRSIQPSLQRTPATLFLPLRVLDHRQRDTVFNAAARIGPLQFHPHAHARVEEALHLDVRRAADGLENGFCAHGGG